MATTDAPLPAGDIQFYDHYAPSLAAGHYTIEARQTLTVDDTEHPFSSQQKIEVRAPQFAIDSGEVESVYPPRNSNGRFARVLPHVVLTKRALPWERTLSGQSRATPWMALLTFAESELSVDPSTNKTTQTTTVHDLLTRSDPDVYTPQIALDDVPPDVRSMQCQTITVDRDLFHALVPTLDELPYLAHVRQINTGNQEIAGVDEHGWYSSVVSNRFPQPGASSDGNGSAADGPSGANVAHLVSLEGLTALLDGSADATAAKVCLVSLTHWSFVSKAPAKENFADLMTALATGSQSQSLLRLPDATSASGSDAAAETAAQTAAQTRLTHGYVPLANHTLPGDETFAWYRGPLTPVEPPALPRPTQEHPHFHSASAAVIYDEQWGVFDHSYAAAWTMGRSLALADKHFATLLLEMRRTGHDVVDRLHTALSASASPADSSSGDLSSAHQPTRFRDVFDAALERGLAADLSEAFASLNGDTPAAPAGEAKESGPGASADPVELRRALHRRDDVRRVVADAVDHVLHPVAEWLARRRLLAGVPVTHLVPDPRMLPVESIRFFYVDSQWLTALTDGAISLGVGSSRDVHLHAALRETLHAVIAEKTLAHRGKQVDAGLRDATPDAPAPESGVPASGLLLRSAVVSGWPGLVVHGEKGGSPVRLLRLARLSPTVLLALFDDVPDTVHLSEPRQHFRFGVEEKPSAAASDTASNGALTGTGIELRSLSDPVGRPTGTFFPSDGDVSQYVRAASGTGQRVLKIHDGDGSLVPALQSALSLSDALSPAGFAVQMVKAPERQSFTSP